ncbi:phosphoribosylanthranilate isomerase [Rugamonas sp. CCM 8940]|uniref:phosphoribosylanthranilate isomerase n=1 Tax=Rugamonas sp. CCM 8940 TaxID=2765359 RepID=UPI0018F46C5C|nr:phosphoribosylanthranilate isomerase [Rugamonas sp. CCM 8940]MBJ7311264.1 phosphoribosylanthranilate isomerase [Rugamonas sp. CCM 8940]
MRERADPVIKICGITRGADAEAAIGAGVQIVGLMFVPGSRRLVTLAQARALAEQLRGRVQLAGVFMDQPYREVEQIAAALDLDLVQLHGDEVAADWLRLGRPLIKRVLPGAGGAGLPAGVVPLLDPGAGSGIAYAWGDCRDDCGNALIAGGLAPDNVAQAILACAPWGVDVSSGVEAGTPGHKDPARIDSFVDQVRRAYRELAARKVAA